MSEVKDVIVQGLWKNNSALVQLLGMCPLLAVTSTQPLLATAAAPAGTSAETILPAILNELYADPEAAAAALAPLALTTPAPETAPEPTDAG